MILFKQDWGRYPSAIVHTSTKNKTWLELCQKFKLMGVENYLFPLSLLNPELEHIDPHDPNLSPELKSAVFMECKFNIWYYLREVHRLAPMASAEGIPLRANRANIAYVWGCMNHLSVGLTMPRQLGKSVIADAVDQWVKDIAARNTTIILVTKNDDLRKKNIARLKKTRLLLPPYMSNISNKDIDNTYEISNTLLGNTFTTVVGQPSVEGANKAGRGLTSAVFHWDEPPFTKNVEIMLSAALPAYVSASAEAAAAGNPHYVGYTTTAGELNTPEGKFMYNLLMGGMWFNENLYDCKDRDQLLQRIRRNSSGDDDLIYINFLHYQLGLTDEWLFKALAKTHSKGAEADRDYFNVWTNGTAAHPFDKVILDLIMASRQEAKYIEISEREYCLNWFISKEDLQERVRSGRKMIAGLDTSDAVGNDYITIVIVDERDLGVIGSFAAKELNLQSFIDWICELVVKYPNLILVPENKSSGTTLIDSLIYKLPALGIDPMKRIYNRMVDDGEYKDPKNEASMMYNRRSSDWWTKNKTNFGFRTTGAGKHARNKLYVDALQNAGNFGGDKVRDSALVSEISSITIKDGRVDHSNGMHDDRVIAWLLAIWMLTLSKNLSYYGINHALSETKDLTRTHGEQVKEPTKYDNYTDRRDLQIKNKIAELLDRISGCTDPILSNNLQREVQALNSKLSNKSVLPKSINELIEMAVKMKQDRINNQNLNKY